MQRIILFDGDCNFCDKSVQFIIKRDPKGYFKFASLQSKIGKELLNKYNAPPGVDSFVLIQDNHCYIKSSAALRVCKKLRGAWQLLYLFLAIPRPLRDFFYEIIARNRFKWFGIKESCRIPSQEERKRFL